MQEIEGFEHALRSLQAQGNVDIYGTGSNAKLLSGELATYLSGRYVEIKIYGLTYREFLQFHNREPGRESLQSYLKFGGLPYLRHLPLDDMVVFDYLRNIVDAILLKDIVSRYDIRNVSFLQRLTRFPADNVGSLVTARKISEYLKSQKIKVSHNLVIDYLAYLANAQLVLRAGRCDIVGKKIFNIGEKYYFEDLGIRHALVGYRTTDINKILENIVFMHLAAGGYDVTVGQLGKKEVDFVCFWLNKPSPPQAAGMVYSGRGFALPLAGSPVTPGRIEFVILRTGRSPPVASHPASRRRSYFQLQARIAFGLKRTRTSLTLCPRGRTRGEFISPNLKAYEPIAA